MRLRASGRAALIVAAGLCIGFSAPLQAQQTTRQAGATAQQPAALGKPLKLKKSGRHRARHSRRHASRHSRRHRRSARRHHGHRTARQAAAKKADESRIKATESVNAGPASDANRTAEAAKVHEATATANSSPVLSDPVANARAQLLSPTTDGTPAPMQTTAPSAPPATFIAQPTPTAARPAPAASNVVASDEVNDIDRSAADISARPSLAKPSLVKPSLAMASLDAPAATATARESPWAQTSLIGKIFIAFGGLLTLASAARMLIA